MKPSENRMPTGPQISPHFLLNPPTATRCSASVAVLANPDPEIRRRITSFALLEQPSPDGTRVCCRVNNLTILAVYAPPGACRLLQDHLNLAESLVSQSPDATILCGDLNAYCRSLGASPPNQAGAITDNFLRPRGSMSFFRADTGPAATRPSSSGAGSIIDQIIGSSVNLTNGKCYDDRDWLSDHRPISCTVTPMGPRHDHATKYFRLRTELLNDPETRSSYAAALRPTCQNLADRIRTLSLSVSPLDSLQARRNMADILESTFTSTILQAAESFLGKKRVPLFSSGPIPDPSPEYVTTQERLQRVYTQLRSLPITAPVPIELLAERDLLKSRLVAVRVHDRKQAYLKWLHDIGTLPPYQLSKIVSRIRRSKAARGAALATTPMALHQYRHHFQAQFTNQFPTEVIPSIPDIPSLELVTSIFTESRIALSILNSSDGKAPGISGLSNDILRPIAFSVAPALTTIFSTLFSLGVVPSSWTRALICPVPKKGDLSLIGHYRPISLTETTRKLYELSFLAYLQQIVPLSREQGGFRASRSTIDQIEALDTLIKYAKKPELVFLDIKAAYDSVPRPVLWKRCLDIGLQPCVVRSLMTLFDHNSAQLAVKQCRSQPFPQPAGVLQGSVLSPLLYAVYIDLLVEKLRSGPSITLPNGSKINCLLYADDIAILASNPSNLATLLRIAQEDSNVRGYRFSPTKCIVVSPTLTAQSLYGAPLTVEDHFNYLGVEFTYKGISEALHIANRIDKLKKQAGVLAGIGARYLGFPRASSLRIYKTFLRPGLEYGLTSLKLSGSLSTLEKAQKAAVAHILGLNRNTNNISLLAICSTEAIVVRQARLRFKRHARLRNLFATPNHLDFALPFVASGLPNLYRIPEPAYETMDALVEALHTGPQTAAIAARFEHSLSLEGLRLPFLPLSPWSESRMTLLWLLRKFDCFDYRCCRCCGNPIRTQSHVSVCGGLS